MKNKLIALIMSTVLLSSASFTIADATVPVDINEMAMLAVYDSDGYLIDIETRPASVKSTSIGCQVETNTKYDNCTYKLILLDSGMILSDIAVTDTSNNILQSIENIPSPTLSPAYPSPTETPLPNASTKPVVSSDSQKYPSVYPSHKDAVSALALVRNVAKTIDENDETIVKIDCFYQGRERTLYIDESIDLTNGNALTTLKKGDMIHFTAKLNGKINTVSLDYRPSSDDIITSNPDISSFQKLIGSDSDFDTALGKNKTGYVFGVISDKNKGSITLCDTDGTLENSVDLSYSRDTIVYVCNMEKKPDVEIGTIAAIIKSSIPDMYKDDDGNITEWNEECDYVYALANVIDDEIVEMIIYTYE